MPKRSANTATYGEDVAKIELILPDDLVERIDRAAEEEGVSRDELLLRFIEEGATRSKAAFRKKIEDMLGPTIPLGDSAQLIREMRDQRLPPSMRPDPEADDD
jgi:Ribbon-helix-helix protein, copG family